MRTLTADVTIRDGGVLRLELATDLPPGPAEVTILIQPKVTPLHGARARSGLFLHRTEAVPASSPDELRREWV